jgi:proline dehydrogenase
VIGRVVSEGAEVMAATHNQASIERAVALMAEHGLPPSSPVYFGQLLGMADHLTFTLGQHGYGVSMCLWHLPSAPCSSVPLG